MLRTFPLMKGWTIEALQARQRDEVMRVGFGNGFPHSRFDPPDHLRKQIDALLTFEDLMSLSSGGETSDEGLIGLETYTQKLIESAKSVAETMSSLMNLINKAPVNLRQKVVFNNVIQSSTVLIGLKIPTDSVTNVDFPECWQRIGVRKSGRPPLLG